MSRACDFLGRIDWFEATGPEDECIERDEGTEAAVTEETPEVVDTRDVEGTDGESELLTEDERKKKSESLIAQATAGAICSTVS